MGNLSIGLQRLLKLADHLEGDKLGADRFDFRYVWRQNTRCGTLACAMGELPFVFPDDWEHTFGSIRRRTHVIAGTYGVPDYFDLTFREGQHLFYAQGQRPEQYGGTHLEEKATRFEVARNIRAFVQFKSKD